MKVLDFESIQSLHIPPKLIFDWCNDVWRMKRQCILPEKVKMWQGNSGRYIAMPCVIPEMDIAGVKFISRNIDAYDGIPARNSNIMLQKCSQSGLYGLVDGIWITNMRTGAIAAHSVIEYGKQDMKTLGIMGLGMAARSFMYILGNIFQANLTVKVLQYKNQAEEFIRRFSKEFPWFCFETVTSCDDICRCDAVISAISFAKSRIADESIFQPGCIVVPIHTGGFQSCDLSFDKIIIDDHNHVRSYQYYHEFKDRAIEIGDIENKIVPGRQNDQERIIAYSGGIALHDIYIAAKLLETAGERGNLVEIPMRQPAERFWI